MKVKKEKGKTWSDKLSPIKSRLGSKKEPYIETEKEKFNFLQLYIKEQV